MDLSEKDRFGIEEMNENHLSYHPSTLSSEWQFNHQPIDPCSVSPSSLPMLDSFLSSLQGWKNPGILPSSFPHFPTDSGFMESVSCYNGGNFSSLANSPFPANEPVSPYKRENDFKGSDNELREAEFSGDRQNQEATNSSGRGSGGKKRRRDNQDLEIDQVQGENLDTKRKGEKNKTTKSSGKIVNDGPDGTKEDYIHVRARRGQATNSHSLAERVRREKISERMKFLQDIVPGCRKVIGKAVMLDEIINYVQSLQKQVEFLSMKLAAVNPRLNLNVDEILSKDLLQLHGGASTSIGFSPDMSHPMLHPFSKAVVQAEISSTVNYALRRAINDHLSSANGYRALTPQMANVWEDDLHNVLGMNSGSNTSLNVEEAHDKSREGFHL